MSWIISLRAVAVFKYPDRMSYNVPADHIWLIDKHPSLFLAETLQEFRRRLEEAPYNKDQAPERVWEIRRIYGVVEVPEGLLTPDQLNLLAG